MQTELEKALRGTAETVFGFDLSDDWTAAQYRDHTNPDALTDAWLESRTSFIWRVGVLAMWDSNKCDWCKLLIGTQRSEKSKPEFIGRLEWAGGENDDPGRVMQRALDVAAMLHPVFDHE